MAKNTKIMRIKNSDHALLKDMKDWLNSEASKQDVGKTYKYPDVLNLALKGRIKRFGRKGGILDVIIILCILVVFALAIPFVAFTYQEIATDLNDTMDLSRNNTGNDLTARQEGYAPMMDTFIFLIFVSLALASVIGSALIKSFPALFIFSAILIALVGVLSGDLANFFEDVVVGDSDLVEFADAMPKTSFIMENLVTFIVLIAILDGIILYAKARSGFE